MGNSKSSAAQRHSQLGVRLNFFSSFLPLFPFPRAIHDMGGCGTKRFIKWAPEDDDNDTAWMEDYDEMLQQMIANNASPDQWEIDLAQKEGLMNPRMEKDGDLLYGHTQQQRGVAWFKFKKAIHHLNGDRSEDLIRAAAIKKLGASPYLQMRAKQWMDFLKQQKLEEA
jgi:hypothetical protein